MALCYISEHHRQAVDANGRTIPVPQDPPLATQVVDFTGRNDFGAVSVAFNAQTTFVELFFDTASQFHISNDPATDADETSMRAAANERVYRGVSGGHKLVVRL